MGVDESFTALEAAVSESTIRERASELLTGRVGRRALLKGVAAASATASAAGALGLAPSASAAPSPSIQGRETLASAAVQGVAATVGEAVISNYVASGVKYMWINGGTDTPPIQEAIVSLSDKGAPVPTLITSLHEYFAMSAAHGYYAVTGDPQVVQVLGSNLNWIE